MLRAVSDPAAHDPDLEALRAAGEQRREVLAAAFDRHRPRLVRMLEARLDPRLKARLGASDVLQEAWLDVSGRLEEFLAQPRLSFFLWIRFLAAQRLAQAHRFHLATKKRAAGRQRSFTRADFPEASPVALIERLASDGTTPTQALARAEARVALTDALARLEPADREILVLRHLEGLSNVEAAEDLGIEPAAASKRHVRALERLRTALDAAAGPGTAP